MKNTMKRISEWIRIGFAVLFLIPAAFFYAVQAIAWYLSAWTLWMVHTCLGNKELSEYWRNAGRHPIQYYQDIGQILDDYQKDMET